MSKPSAGRKVRDRAEAAELLAAWESSDERISDWCAARGINWYSLNAYLGRRAVPSSTEVEFVELAVARPAATEAAGHYRIVVGDIDVEVDDHFREDTLFRLLQVVAAC